MSKHTDQHMQLLSGLSASSRRATKIAKLIETAPPLEAEQIRKLSELLYRHLNQGSSR